jgi:hypothetical protein
LALTELCAQRGQGTRNGPVQHARNPDSVADCCDPHILRTTHATALVQAGRALFLPTKIAGWLILLCGIAYAVYVFIDIDGRSHSASDTLINFAFNLLIIAAVYSLLGYLTSRPAKLR